jgi:hypothetical protein
MQPLQVSMAGDLSTGFDAVTVLISAEYDVTPEMVNRIAPQLRVASFPGNVVVPATQSIVNTPRFVNNHNVTVSAFTNVEEQLDAGLDGSEWYAVSLPANPSRYVLTTDWWLFAFEDGNLGVRVSPTHPPVVASMMSCHKDAGVVGVYVRYSESVSMAAGMPSLDYGTPPVACSVSADAPTETQFICAGEDAQPFSLHLPDGVTATASGRPMAPGTLASTGLQISEIPGELCTIYKQLTVN